MIWDINGKEVLDISGINVGSIYEIIVTSPLDDSKEIVFTLVNYIADRNKFSDGLDRVNFTDIYCSILENKDDDYNWKFIDLLRGNDEMREVMRVKTIEQQFFEKYPEYQI